MSDKNPRELVMYAERPKSNRRRIIKQTGFEMLNDAEIEIGERVLFREVAPQENNILGENVYVVIRAIGNYEDYRTQPIKAFANEGHAKEFAKQLKDAAIDAAERHQKAETDCADFESDGSDEAMSKIDELYYAASEIKSKLDPELEGFLAIDASYFVVPVALVK